MRQTYFSRNFNDGTEWQLNPKVITRFGKPDIDLFASRLNHQLTKYISWHPEPNAIAIDAFTICWSDKFLYVFPPFSLLNKVIAKICRDKAKGILIVPKWPTQTWYPQAIALAQEEIITFPPSGKNLKLVHEPTPKHPLQKKLSLMVIHFNLNN